MAEHICPWWIGYLLASPLRRLLQDPRHILSPHVHEGMTVLEPGPGMGFFTLELARLVGPAGRVVAVDVQPRMLAGLRRRAARKGLQDRVVVRQAPPETLAVADLAGQVDFALAFAMVHELPVGTPFFAEVAATLKSDACLLLVEPSGHVPPEAFQAEVHTAARAGLRTVAHPSIWHSHAALLRKSA